MNTGQVGNIIRKLRIDKDLTQKQLADLLGISDKAISKWECGLGCPDVSLLSDLSEILNVAIDTILNASLPINDTVGGNMKNSRYFSCPTCGNISVCTGNAEVYCCGRKLEAMKAQKATEENKLKVELVENDWYITSGHPMTKENYISFVAFATGDRIQLFKQYPEWNLQVRFQKRGMGTLLWYSIDQGLQYQLLR